MWKIYLFFTIFTLGITTIFISSAYSLPQNIIDKSSALLLIGTRSENTLQKIYNNANKKIRVLIVPGHDDAYPGAAYRGVREEDLNLALGEELKKLFAKDSHFETFITRSGDGYTKPFINLFAEEQKGISAFQKYVQYYTRLFKRSGIITSKPSLIHNTAKPENAAKLYGINWWANGNNIDLVLHIHFNDYPRKKRSEPGKYTGFTIYYPELQLPNYEATKNLAQSLHKYFSTYFAPSNLEKENGGLVASQELIAIGSNGSLESAALLIEYAYIYEKKLQSPETRATFINEAAFRTYEGIIKYLKETK